ncbi:VOC family protein [Corynebacterium tapiri]|uniref:VOC family protein n=1 Tax=Corynebacterium tapiri TaxID=1448266 RepID=A0A5C4U4H7_9CORY|nr:VOC family protein [Corynebacterium tapiri]TNL97630.1 VOC family protein [Corynebacterium tapiri]
MALHPIPYIDFNGRTKEALEFYADIFGGSTTISVFRDLMTAEQVGEDHLDKVMHGELTVDGEPMLFASDGQPGKTPTYGDAIQLSLVTNSAHAERYTTYFNALAADGEVAMPLERAPWGAHFGIVNDKYGLSWYFNIED